ncbi:MAG TPA: STAS domain-containing protein [Conexibacter sp.]|nr:STAS domain-containing protein [Conexibacter sp.]
MPSTPLFRVDVQPERERVRVIPHGELDLGSVTQLETQIEELRSRGFATIVLDLRQLTFMDSTGLRLLLRFDAESRSNGLHFAIIDCEGPVRRLLELTRIDGRFRYADE